MALKSELVPLESLRRLPRNAKQHDGGAIHQSIRRWGFLERILVNETTGHIVSGAGRTDVLQGMKARGERPPEGVAERDGGWLVPVDVVSLPADEEEAAAVALNRTVELGGWDEGLLAQVLADIAARGEGALDGVGYDREDVDALLAARTPPDGWKEYDESADKDVQFVTCPSCGHRFPK